MASTGSMPPARTTTTSASRPSTGGCREDLTDTVSAQFQFTGQYAFTDLPSAVNFSLGGETYGRAFDNGAIAGQSGYAVAFEMGKKLDLGIDWLTAFSRVRLRRLRRGVEPAGPRTVRVRLASARPASASARSSAATPCSRPGSRCPTRTSRELGVEGTTVRFNAGVQF